MYVELQLKQDILAYKSVFTSPNILLFCFCFYFDVSEKGAKVYYQSSNVYYFFLPMKNKSITNGTTWPRQGNQG